MQRNRDVRAFRFALIREPLRTGSALSAVLWTCAAQRGAFIYVIPRRHSRAIKYQFFTL